MHWRLKEIKPKKPKMDNELITIYQNRVSHIKTNNYAFHSYNFNPVSTFERDPNLIKLEQSIFGKIQEIAGKDNNLPEYKKNGIQNISVEDAIKELIELEKLV